MGCFLISFCLGNTLLPFGHGLPHDIQLDRELLLRESFCFSFAGIFFFKQKENAEMREVYIL